MCRSRPVRKTMNNEIVALTEEGNFALELTAVGFTAAGTVFERLQLLVHVAGNHGLQETAH